MEKEEVRSMNLYKIGSRLGSRLKYKSGIITSVLYEYAVSSRYRLNVKFLCQKGQEARYVLGQNMAVI